MVVADHLLLVIHQLVRLNLSDSFVDERVHVARELPLLCVDMFFDEVAVERLPVLHLLPPFHGHDASVITLGFSL